MIFRFDTHVHTSQISPCAQVPAEEVVRLYREAGYSGICITDHYREDTLKHGGDAAWEQHVDRYLRGYRAARAAGVKAGLTVLLGAELTFPGSPNDYLLYGLTEELLRRSPALYTLGIARLREWADRSGVLIFQAHPFREYLTREDPAFLDGVEAINGNPRHNSHNDRAFAFAEEHRLLKSAGSDFHQPEDIARSGLRTSSPITTEDALIAALRGGTAELIRPRE